MKMKHCILLAVLLMVGIAQAQTPDQPSDFLSKEFHKERREKLRARLAANSVAVFFANPVRNRSNDVDYVYHQDPNFFYFTGYREPHAVLLIFKEMQTAANGSKYNEIIFVQPRDATREMWNGRRLGDEQTRTLLGLEQAFNNTEFEKYALDFARFDKILFYDFMNDVRDEEGPSDLFDLIEQFKTKVRYPVKDASTLPHAETPVTNLDTHTLDGIMGELRSVKTPEELDLIRRAVAISTVGQVEVMKAIKPGMSEREIQGLHEFVFKKYQAEDVGYPSIVGGGHNGCILHYIDNYKPALDAKELILMDLGAEYHGYTADVTRTIPVNGTFSTEQKAIYNIVLKAQEDAMKICKEGTTFTELFNATLSTVNQGLAELGIIKPEDVTKRNIYYPHGCCHHIGLDVHDKGTREKLRESMVITIEPGIYINEGSNCDKQWWGIAVRIEDDFLVKKAGCELLSDRAPRKPEEVEALMRQPSALDDFQLPGLEKN